MLDARDTSVNKAGLVTARPKLAIQAGATDKEALQFTVIKPVMGEYRMLRGRGGTGVGKGHLTQTWGVGKHPE